MSDDNRDDEYGRPEADDDLGIPIVPESDYDEPEEVVPLDESEATPELHGINVPPVDEGFEDLPHEEQPEEPLEPLNPWISIVVRPRDTIHYVLATGHWNNWFVVYSILFLMSLVPGYVGMFAQPDPMAPFEAFPFLMDIPMPILFAVILLVGMVVLYPIALGFVLLKGWLYSVVGKWLGGTATAAEARIAIVWGNAMQKYIGYIGLPVQFGVIAYYRANPDVTDLTVILVSLVMVALMSPLWIYAIIVHCKALAEAHQFSAWSAFGASCIMFAFYVMAYIALVIGVFIAVFAFAAIVSAA